MNSEQLNSARLARWSQNGEARLTLEAAAEWLGTIGFCPYLPLGAIPAHSFVEAVVGRPAPMPSAGERSRANELLVRLVENALAMPLKIGASLSEQPDFIASPDTLRYIYALRGNRNFKGAPSTVGNDKVTPLALHCWQAIGENGPLDIAALQPILGRDITEAAIVRALHELWAALYIFPALSVTGQPSKWDLLYHRFPQQAAAGSSTGHAEAQSAMVSLYLHAVVAVPEEDILSFLSPLAPQSKLREVVRGLGSMRQLDIIDIGGRSHVCLQGGLLPEMVAQLSEEQLAASSADIGIEIEPAPQSRNSDARSGNDSDRVKKFVPKKFVPRHSESGQFKPRRFDLQAAGRRTGPSRPSQFARKGPSTGTPGRFDKFRSDDRGDGKRRSFEKRNPDSRRPGERAKRWGKSGEQVDREPSRDRVFPAKSSFKSSGFKPAGPKRWTQKGDDSRSQSTKSGRTRPLFRSGPGGASGGAESERRDHWKKPRFGAKRQDDRRPFTDKPARFKSEDSRSRGAKPWPSKGAESRVGSTKSYRARTGDKPSGAKPWTRQSSSAAGGAGNKPRYREKDEAPVGEKPNKPGAKPFWARNPRGGKGSVASSRTNRPRGGKGGKRK